MAAEVKVGIADLNVVLDPGTIMTIGLGSCIGIALYDKTKKSIQIIFLNCNNLLDYD